MPLIQLPTGKTIYVSLFEYYFLYEDRDMDEFYQACIADDLGEYIEDPFSNKLSRRKVEIEKEDELPEVGEIPDLDLNI